MQEKRRSSLLMHHNLLVMQVKLCLVELDGPLEKVRRAHGSQALSSTEVTKLSSTTYFALSSLPITFFCRGM